jgi:hypothetical protein
MNEQLWRLSPILLALCATAFLTAGGWYEQVVLDSAWPRNPDLVRPATGGANRKKFWIPAHASGAVALALALWAAWPVAVARDATLVAVAFYILITLVTVRYFAPAVLKVERDSVEPNAPSSLTWVRRSRWRMPLAVGMNIALAVAALSFVASRR